MEDRESEVRERGVKRVKRGRGRMERVRWPGRGMRYEVEGRIKEGEEGGY